MQSRLVLIARQRHHQKNVRQKLNLSLETKTDIDIFLLTQTFLLRRSPAKVLLWKIKLWGQSTIWVKELKEFPKNQPAGGQMGLGSNPVLLPVTYQS